MNLITGSERCAPMIGSAELRFQLYGCMSFDEAEGKAGHCDFCAEGVEAGGTPAGVQHCTGGALRFVAPEEVASLTEGRHASCSGLVCYISNRWRLQKPAL